MPYRVMFIDDDQFLLDMYALKFKQSGHEVESFMEGGAALEALRGGANVDAVVLDEVMPGLNGRAILETLKNENLAPGAAHIVLSNQGQDDDVAAAKALGADEYIIKASVVPTEVVEKVVAAIEAKRHTKE